MEHILEVRNINKFFGAHHVLKDVSFTAKAGQVHALVGENGAGKSTLMNIIGGIHQPNSGELILNGQPATIQNPWHAREMGISVVFQELSLTPNMSVAQNIFVRREPTHGFGLINWRKLYRDVQELFDRIGVDISPKELVSNYSVSRQQIIEIAKAISFDAKIIIMDEPTSALSETEVDSLYRIIEELQKRGVAIVFISHKLGEVFRIADEISVLRDGEIVGNVAPQSSTERDVIRLMVGRHIDDLYPEKSDSVDDVIFEVQHLTRQPYFEDISFQLRRGEILGFAGLVGAGRTETARAIFGADLLSQGKVYINGQQVSINNPKQAIENGIVYLTEDRKQMGLFLPMTMRENITSASLSKFTNAVGVIKHKAIARQSREYVELVDIRPQDDTRKVIELSGGNQQKSLLAKCLSANPTVLIADEPTRGVDIGAKAKIHQDLRDLANNGIGVIVISSELPEVIGLSDRVAVFREGTLTTFLSGEEITQEEIMRHAIQ